MSTNPKFVFTPEEYLALERKADTKTEYYDGEAFLMSGASRNHNLIVVNVAAELRNSVKGRPCEVYPSDMRVRIPQTSRYFYPDVSVVCGDPRFEDAYSDILLNPTLIVEVLSESTEAFDRVRKLDSYRRIPSLQEYLLISQNESRVLQYARQPAERWLLSEAASPEAVLSLTSIGCSLLLSEVYSKVEFEAQGRKDPPR